LNCSSVDREVPIATHADAEAQVIVALNGGRGAPLIGVDVQDRPPLVLRYHLAALDDRQTRAVRQVIGPPIPEGRTISCQFAPLSLLIRPVDPSPAVSVAFPSSSLPIAMQWNAAQLRS
jgi:hypothetical protein